MSRETNLEYLRPEVLDNLATACRKCIAGLWESWEPVELDIKVPGMHSEQKVRGYWAGGLMRIDIKP